MRSGMQGNVLATKAVEAQRQRQCPTAARAVETQGKDSVSAAKAVETLGNGGVFVAKSMERKDTAKGVQTLGNGGALQRDDAEFGDDPSGPRVSAVAPARGACR